MSIDNLFVRNIYSLFGYNMDIENQLILENVLGLTGPNVTLGVNTVTGIVGSVAGTTGPTGPPGPVGVLTTMTSNMTLTSGTITSLTVRGVTGTAPWPITMNLSLNGTTAMLTIPQFTMGITGGSLGDILFSGTLPAGYTPTNAISLPCLLNNISSASATNFVQIGSNSAISIHNRGAANPSPNAINDICVTWLVV